MSTRRASTAPATACASPAIVISPYARHGYVDHQTLSFDAYAKFIEDDFLGGQRLDPHTDGRADPRPDVREALPILGNLAQRLRLHAEASAAADPVTSTYGARRGTAVEEDEAAAIAKPRAAELAPRSNSGYMCEPHKTCG